MKAWVRCDGAADCPHVTRWYRGDSYICFDCQRVADDMASRLSDAVPIFAKGDKSSPAYAMFFKWNPYMIAELPKRLGVITIVGP